MRLLDQFGAAARTSISAARSSAELDRFAAAPGRPLRAGLGRRCSRRRSRVSSARAVRDAGVTVYERSQVRGDRIRTAHERRARSRLDHRRPGGARGQRLGRVDPRDRRRPDRRRQRRDRHRAAPERLAETGAEAGTSASPTAAASSTTTTRPPTAGMVFGKGGGTLAYSNRITATFDHPGRRERRDPQPAAPHLSVALGCAGRRQLERADRLLAERASVLRAAARGARACWSAPASPGTASAPRGLPARSWRNWRPGRQRRPAGRAAQRAQRRRLPPEPIRYVGGRLVRAAIARKERS